MTPPQGAKRLADWLAETTALLAAAGVEAPARDARLLAAAGAGLSSADILAEPGLMLTPKQVDILAAMRRRRAAREPISRILGQRGFMNLQMEISPATLDPRPDTEVLVEAAIELVTREGRRDASLSVVDLGTGSGAILIALLQALPRARGLGIDIAQDALAVAARNGRGAGVADRVAWRCGNWLDGVDERFDLIVSNPPYIRSGDIPALEPEVSRYDPPAALDGGPDGLAAYRSVIAASASHIRAGGWLLLELGAGQHQDVGCLLLNGGFGEAPAPAFFPDLSGHLRCVAQKAHKS